jgi:hypothetical protein
MGGAGSQGADRERLCGGLRRDPDQQMRWVVLSDGQDELLRQVYAAAKRYKVEITVVQEFVHVLEYLWKAAHALYPGEPEPPTHGC